MGELRDLFVSTAARVADHREGGGERPVFPNPADIAAARALLGPLPARPAPAADRLTTGWDQPAFNAVTSPAAALVEDVTGRWLKELLGLPSGASFGF